MNFILLAPIHNLRISEDLGAGLSLQDPLTITNNVEVIQRLLTPEFRSICGSAQTDLLETAPMVLYWKVLGSQSTASAPEREMNLWQRVLHLALKTYHQFAFCLWMLEDNATYVSDGYAAIPVDGGRMMALSSSLTPTYYDSSGTSQEVVVTAEAILKALDLRRVWATHFSETLESDREPTLTEILSSGFQQRASLGSHKGSTRLSRFFYLVQTARSACDLGIRISLYCSALEALFTTDSSEVSHKVAERVSWLLEPDAETRHKQYTEMKRAYGVRSKILHGSNVSFKTATELVDTSRRLDFVLRRVFGCLLTDESLLTQFGAPQEALERHLVQSAMRS